MDYQANQFGIVYGPYGGIGFIQREDLRNVAFSIRGLFRWAKKILGR